MSAPRSPSGDPPRAGRGPPASLIAVIAVALAVRLAVGGTIHLTEDEAYYRLWSMTPAWGYYDHPPMIALWIWLGRHAAGDTPLGVRLLPTLASAAISLLVFDLARLAGAARPEAARAGVWYNAMLLVAAGGFLAVPDSAAALFWTLALWCALKAAPASIGWWLAAGAAAGLAALSKYSALFLAPGIFLWLAWTPAGRRQLAGPGPWLAAVVALSVFGLNVGWNASHGWVTFAKQFGRVAPTRLALRYLAEFLVTQGLLLNPLIAAFLVRAMAARRQPDRRASAIVPFIATSLPFIAYLLIHSLHDRVQAHWPAPIYPALAVIAALGARDVSASILWATLRRAAPVLGLGVFALMLAYLAAPAKVVDALDLARPVRGWTPFAARLEGLRTQAHAAWIGTASYGLAAELADEPSLRAPVLQISERARYQGLGPAAPPDLTRPGLLVDLPRRIDLAALRRCFAGVEPLGTVVRGEPGEANTAYEAILVFSPTRDIPRAGC